MIKDSYFCLLPLKEQYEEKTNSDHRWHTIDDRRFCWRYYGYKHNLALFREWRSIWNRLVASCLRYVFQKDLISFPFPNSLPVTDISRSRYTQYMNSYSLPLYLLQGDLLLLFLYG